MHRALWMSLCAGGRAMTQLRDRDGLREVIAVLLMSWSLWGAEDARIPQAVDAIIEAVEKRL
jgi:hypothetical protein